MGSGVAGPGCPRAALATSCVRPLAVLAVCRVYPLGFPAVAFAYSPARLSAFTLMLFYASFKLGSLPGAGSLRAGRLLFIFAPHFADHDYPKRQMATQDRRQKSLQTRRP
ncbi:unnamed protein product [Amoebophrya sp. A120]|nr:unnamed protein product [Amoebophrya sp. A120]|eukprot:GSA120T00019349001.1